MQPRRKIAIAGAGYVGLTSAVCFSEMGHQVALVEVNAERLAQLQRGECPFYEPGVPELLSRHLGGRLQVTNCLAGAVCGAEALFLCVGTPPRPSGAPDLGALRGVLRDLRAIKELQPLTVVLKSTVLPGTNRMAHHLLHQRHPIVSNPEFLREGTAVRDFFQPDRIVVGSPDEAAALRIASLYTGVQAPLLVTGWEEAELVKYVTNAFLAVKISFANEVASLCEALEMDAPDVLKGLGLDHRVSPHFLHPGPGYGGSCLPKDLAALTWRARKAGVRLDLMPAAQRANRRQRERLFARLARELDGLAGRRVAIWGLAFKAETDDLRSAAAVELVPRLLAAGASVAVHDPKALENFTRQFPLQEHSGLLVPGDHWSALENADALLILTEWETYRQASPFEIAGRLSGDLVVDGRNLLDPDSATAAGLRYLGVGRKRRK